MELVELGGAAERAQEEVRKTAGWLARSLAGARKRWEGQGGDHLQPPRPFCIPLLLSREGGPKTQTRPRILEHQARGRRPGRQG